MTLGGTRTHSHRALSGFAAIALAALALLALPGVDRAHAGGGCPNAHAAIDEANAAQLANSVRCLINRERGSHDVQKLANNEKLEDAARKHNRTMLDENCWKHDCPGEPDLERRIKNTGYLNGADRWIFGQLFGCAATPRAMLNTWLQHDAQRRMIREPRFRDIGVAAARDQVGASSCDGGDEVTYTVVFARRWG